MPDELDYEGLIEGIIAQAFADLFVRPVKRHYTRRDGTRQTIKRIPKSRHVINSSRAFFANSDGLILYCELLGIEPYSVMQFVQNAQQHADQIEGWQAKKLMIKYLRQLQNE